MIDRYEKGGQQLVPGLVGMSVHTDCVYLREIHAAGLRNEVTPQINNTKVVLHTTDFALLTRAITSGNSAVIEATVGQAVAGLQQAGVDFLVVTANTMHATLPSLQDVIKVPVLDITDVVLTEAHERGLTRVGLLGTSSTLASGIYDKAAAAFGIAIVHPTTQIAEAIDAAIFHRLVYGVCTEEDVETARQALTWFREQGADGVILGCTDITLIADRLADFPLPLLDSTVLHAHAAHYVARTGDVERFADRRYRSRSLA